MAVAIFGSAWAVAHEGHDHGAPPPPVTTTIAPRLDSSSDQFELVAIFRSGKLHIFVDRFVTNEPVTDAEVEVETPTGPAKAARNPDGSFAIDAPWAKPGESLDLIFTVSSGADLDVLTGTSGCPRGGRAFGVVGERLLVRRQRGRKGRPRQDRGYDLTLPVVALGAFLLGMLAARRRGRNAAAAAVAPARFS